MKFVADGYFMRYLYFWMTSWVTFLVSVMFLGHCGLDIL